MFRFVDEKCTDKAGLKKYYYIIIPHSRILYDKYTEALYKNRKAPLIPFEGKVVSVCKDLLSSTAINTFFKGLQGKSGGIYMFTLKSNSSIFYIGRAKDFQKRLKSHFNANLSDRFHVFAKTVGWDKFEFSVIEICDLNMQKEREDFYLQKYLPLLNTIFKSNFNNIQTYDSLYEMLKLKQLQSNFENKYQGIIVYLYEYISSTGKLNTTCKTFNSIHEASNYLGVARETINMYLNTYVPYKNNLFLTNNIESFELVEKLISDATLGLELERTIAKKIWVYFLNEKGNIVKNIYESKSAVAKLLNVQHGVINNHLDKWIIGGIKGNYVFSKELDNLEMEKFEELLSLRKFNNCRVWIYDALSLDLLADPFSSMQKAADYLNVDYRSILNHLDTELAIIKGGKSVLFFSRELAKAKKESLLNNVKKAANTTVSLWVYKKVDGNFVLINNNKPSYASRFEASKDLKISPKTINKYLDTNKEYKGLFFFSVAVAS